MIDDLHVSLGLFDIVMFVTNVALSNKNAFVSLQYEGYRCHHSIHDRQPFYILRLIPS